MVDGSDKVSGFLGDCHWLVDFVWIFCLIDDKNSTDYDTTSSEFNNYQYIYHS